MCHGRTIRYVFSSSETIATWSMDACWDDAWNTCQKKRAGRVEMVSHGRKKTNTVSQDTSEGWEITLDYARHFSNRPLFYLDFCNSVRFLALSVCLFVPRLYSQTPIPSISFFLFLRSSSTNQPTNHYHQQQ